MRLGRARYHLSIPWKGLLLGLLYIPALRERGHRCKQKAPVGNFCAFRTPCVDIIAVAGKGLPTREPLFVLLLVLLFVVEEVLVLHDCQIGNRFGRRAVGIVVPVPYAFRVHIAV